jgi:hypothetical protein
LTATNRSHPFVQDPVDHRKMYYVQPWCPDRSKEKLWGLDFKR